MEGSTYWKKSQGGKKSKKEKTGDVIANTKPSIAATSSGGTLHLSKHEERKEEGEGTEYIKKSGML